MTTAPRSGCQRCRKRHIKCVIKEGEDTCQPCTKQKRECIRGGNFTFKLIHSVPQRRRGSTSRVFFGYSPTQTWVPVPTIVDFVVDPCGSEEDVESVASSPASLRSASAEPYLASGSFGDFGDPESENNFQPQSYIQDEVANSGLISLSNTRSSASSAGVVQNERGPSGPGDAEPTPRSERDLNFAQSEISRKSQNRALHDSNVSFHSPTSQISAPSKSTPRLEGQQAILLRNYIENVAPWADAGDPLKHFATVVPQRAMQHPILLNAIFAISAQNLSLVSNYDAIQGPHYYDKCISLMIPLISPHVEEDYDENLLAATVLLRTYEEMDVEDNKFHLFGSTKILNSVTKFSSSGGLGEAATWVILRQDLYISLVTKEPLFIRLENYERSHSFLKQNDYSWANIMVLLAAKVLSAAFARQTSVAREEWLRLEAAIEEWNMSKPDTFNPLGVHEAPIAKQQAFPEIWMLDDSHVVGVQYYHVAALFLQAYKPIMERPGFDFLKMSRERENSINGHLRSILGLTLGNPKVQNGWFASSHILSSCGCYLRHVEERQVALQLLKTMQETMGWKCEMIASQLEEQWAALDATSVR